MEGIVKPANSNDSKPKSDNIGLESPSSLSNISKSSTPSLSKIIPSRPIDQSSRPKSSNGVFRPGRPFFGMSNIAEYEIIEKLGEGTFGEVSKARQLRTGKLVALKKLLVHNAKEGFPITALREITILKQLKNKNVLTLLDMSFKENQKNKKGRCDFYMVTPYMSYDLTGLLENPKVHLQVPHIKCLMIQLLHGIQFVHEQHFFHRDIKAANILIDFNGILKIADFGLARKYHGRVPKLGQGAGGGERPYTGLVVTRWYRPPELLIGERKYTTAVDMWGIGCVFGEMFTHKPILAGKSDPNQAEIIFHLVGSPDAKSWPGFFELPNRNSVLLGPFKRTLEERFQKIGKDGVSLLDKLLKLDPKRRYNALDALEHPYFKNEPLPVQPHELPKYEESHEIDLKRYKEEREKEKASLKVPLPSAPKVIYNDHNDRPHDINDSHRYNNDRNGRSQERNDNHRYNNDQGAYHHNNYKKYPNDQSYSSRSRSGNRKFNDSVVNNDQTGGTGGNAAQYYSKDVGYNNRNTYAKDYGYSDNYGTSRGNYQRGGGYYNQYKSDQQRDFYGNYNNQNNDYNNHYYDGDGYGYDNYHRNNDYQSEVNYDDQNNQEDLDPYKNNDDNHEEQSEDRNKGNSTNYDHDYKAEDAEVEGLFNDSTTGPSSVPATRGSKEAIAPIEAKKTVTPPKPKASRFADYSLRDRDSDFRREPKTYRSAATVNTSTDLTAKMFGFLGDQNMGHKKSENVKEMPLDRNKPGPKIPGVKDITSGAPSDTESPAKKQKLDAPPKPTPPKAPFKANPKYATSSIFMKSQPRKRPSVIPPKSDTNLALLNITSGNKIHPHPPAPRQPYPSAPRQPYPSAPRQPHSASSVPSSQNTPKVPPKTVTASHNTPNAPSIAVSPYEHIQSPLRSTTDIIPINSQLSSPLTPMSSHSPDSDFMMDRSDYGAFSSKDELDYSKLPKGPASQGK